MNRKQCGWFQLPERMIKECDPMALALFAKCIPIDCSFNPAAEVYEYWVICRDFRELDSGEIMPEYIPKFEHKVDKKGHGYVHVWFMEAPLKNRSSHLRVS